jgi:hypothetical protein
MASQVSHIVYAKRYFDQLENGKVENGFGKLEKDEFLLGSVFPDIRRIDESVSRRDTHLYFPVLDLDFSGLTSFEAGWKFHLYCDMRREEILNSYNFYDLPHTADFYNQPAKNVEDRVVYEKYDNWEKLVNYFNGVKFIDSGIGVEKETFGLWYAILAKYFERPIDEKSIRAFLIKKASLAKKIDAIMASVSEISKNKKAVEILSGVWKEIV